MGFMTFGAFASKESEGVEISGVDTIGSSSVDTAISDLSDANSEVQQELVEMQNADETIEEMKDELAQAAVNYAEATGEEKPSSVEIDGEEVTEVSSDIEPEINASEGNIEEQVEEKAVELEATVENLMGRLMKTSAYKGKERLGIYSKFSKRVDLQAIRKNPINSYAQSMEELGETIKKAGKAVWEWVKNLWNKIKDIISNFIPMIKNFRAKGQDIIKKCKDIKRPELKNDEKGDWSEKFIVFRDYYDGLKGSFTSNISGYIEGPIAEINVIIEHFSKLNVKDTSNLKADSILNKYNNLFQTIKSKGLLKTSNKTKDLQAYSVTDSNLKYEVDELYFVSPLSNDLSVQAFNVDNVNDYIEYMKSLSEDEKTVKLECGAYRIQYKENEGKKKKHEEKIPARELVDFASNLGEYLVYYGRVENSLKKANDNMKKFLDNVEKYKLSSKSGANDASKKRFDKTLDDLPRVIKTFMGAFANMTSFPKLVLNVANEALDAVKDGDKE